MSNLVFEMLIRLIKPVAALLIGAVIYLVAVALGEPASIALGLVSFVSGGILILLIQESPL